MRKAAIRVAVGGRIISCCCVLHENLHQTSHLGKCSFNFRFSFSPRNCVIMRDV